jgi:hypothetical protein
MQGIEITSDGTDGTDDILGGVVVEGILNPQNYPLNPDDIGWSGLSGVAQGGQPSFAQIASGGSVRWSTGDESVVTTATVPAETPVLLDAGQNTTFSSYTSEGFFGGQRDINRNYVFVSATDYRNTFGTNSLEPVIGLEITGQYIQSNTTITDGRINEEGNYGFFRLSRFLENTGFENEQVAAAANEQDAWTVTFNPTLENRNFAFLTKDSFETAGAGAGTEVTGGSVTFPANTLVNNVSLRSFGSLEFYQVQFNNTFSGTLQQNTGEIEFTFSQPPYAQPGETVFSFIAQPGELSELSLDALKELTNTPLGGRGTFPNGPDVLAINVYKVSGADTEANIVIKWGEAQA